MAELVDRDKIRRELVPTLSSLIDETIDAAKSAGKTLDAAVLFGSAVGKGYVPGKSDVNIFVTFDHVDVALLSALRPVFNRYFKKLRARPVVVDREFLANSSDVFPMEFFEWKERGKLIYGSDPLAGIQISQENLRYQIEENLRGKRLRLIQSFLSLEPSNRRLQAFMEETLPNFITVLRGILRMMGESSHRDAVGLVDAVEEKSGVSLTHIRRLLRIKTDEVKIELKEIDIIFRGYLEDLDALCYFVDKYKAGK